MGNGMRMKVLTMEEKILLFGESDIQFSLKTIDGLERVIEQALKEKRFSFSNRDLKNYILGEIYRTLYKTIMLYEKTEEKEKNSGKIEIEDIIIKLMHNIIRLNGGNIIEDNGYKFLISIKDIYNETYYIEVKESSNLTDLIISEYKNILSREDVVDKIDLNSHIFFEELLKENNRCLYNIAKNGKSYYTYVSYRNKILHYVYNFYSSDNKKTRVLKAFNNKRKA